MLAVRSWNTAGNLVSGEKSKSAEFHLIRKVTTTVSARLRSQPNAAIFSFISANFQNKRARNGARDAQRMQLGLSHKVSGSRYSPVRTVSLSLPSPHTIGGLGTVEALHSDGLGPKLSPSAC